MVSAGLGDMLRTSSRLTMDAATLPPEVYDEEEEVTQVDATMGWQLGASLKRDRLILMRLDGIDAGQIIPIPRRPLTIGRGDEADLVIRQKSVSREHARLLPVGDHIECRDLESSFGTYVNDVPQRRFVLEHGQFVRFGQAARFVVELVSEEQEAVLVQLHESAVRDPLTQAFGRKYFEQRLAAEFSHAERHRAPLAIALMDLDRFKTVNDRFGHPTGDAVLRHLAALTQERLRLSDVFARIGGEEFAIILRRTDIEGARRVAERVRTALSARPVFHDGHAIAVTISLGCASVSCDGVRTEEELVRLADYRLYAAKAKGRNRVVVTGAPSDETEDTAPRVDR